MMNDGGKSDNPIVPGKPPNKGARAPAEAAEGRGLAKGNPLGQNTPRTQSRRGVPSALERVREAARADKRQRLTALLHHVYAPEMLEHCYRSLRREAAAGIDGQTWRQYGEELAGNLQDLSERLKRGAYRAKPVKRVQIPKPDGRLRPIGLPSLEDKIVQRAVAQVLNAIYEQEFLGFSYGFRPGRNPHQALDALYVAIKVKKVSWVLDADIGEFFDTLSHQWLVKFIEHRIGDRRIIRLIKKWLKAGVLEDGRRVVKEQGTVQGGSISPVLANIYLHYVFDLWAHRWRRKHARGEVYLVRFADDIVACFQHRHEAERFLVDLRQRFCKFALQLNPQKTRLIEFGRFAAKNRRDRGEGKPETFNFLGFTHICGKTRAGKFTVLRKTMRKKLTAKLKEVRAKLRRRMHEPVPAQGAYLRSVVSGHIRYFGVPMNGHCIGVFHMEVCRMWMRMLRRRSQKHTLRWDRMRRLIAKWLPPARICHPYPLERFGVIT